MHIHQFRRKLNKSGKNLLCESNPGGQDLMSLSFISPSRCQQAYIQLKIHVSPYERICFRRHLIDQVLGNTIRRTS
ncbi:hypothetical protein Hanom_Chr07g00676221 [Helianthus anomalus]